MLFYLDTDTYSQRAFLTPSVSWPKFGSDKDWVDQLLIQFVQDKSLGSQEETDYALCWQQGPVVIFPLGARDQKENEEETQEYSGTSYPSWGPLGLLPPPFNPQNGAGPPPATAATAVAAGGTREGRGTEPQAGTSEQAQRTAAAHSQNRRVKLQAQVCCPGL